LVVSIPHDVEKNDLWAFVCLSSFLFKESPNILDWKLVTGWIRIFWN